MKDTVTITINDPNIPTRFHGDYVLKHLTPKDINKEDYLTLPPEEQYKLIVSKMLVQKPKDTPNNIEEFPIPIYMQLTQKISDMLGVTKEIQKECLRLLNQPSKFTV